MLKTGEVHRVRYTKSDDEVTERSIIPTFVPKANVKAIDVSDLSEADQAEMAEMLAGYKQYLEDLASRTFSFEDWVSHTTGKDIVAKWRTFKVDGLTVL